MLYIIIYIVCITYPYIYNVYSYIYIYVYLFIYLFIYIHLYINKATYDAWDAHPKGQPGLQSLHRLLRHADPVALGDAGSLCCPEIPEILKYDV